MKRFAMPGALALAVIPAAALAQQPEICQRVEFSPQVLERFPNIRSACLDVISKDGVEYAVVKADLVRATARRMTVRVQLPDGSHTEPMGINVKPNERLNINGKLTPIQDVAIGQEVTAYVHVTDPGIALASDAAGPVEFTVIEVEPAPAPAPAASVAEAPAPAMPKTATRLPLLGTIGLILLALGTGLAWYRRRAQA